MALATKLARARARASEKDVRRAIAAGPLSILLAMVTLTFVAAPAVGLVRGEPAEPTLLGSMHVIVAVTAAAIMGGLGLAFTFGRVIDRLTRDLDDGVAAAAFGAAGLVFGLVFAGIVIAALAIRGTAPGQDVWQALVLALVVPSTISALGTRLVVAPVAASVRQIALVAVAAASSVALFLWSAQTIALSPTP